MLKQLFLFQCFVDVITNILAGAQPINKADKQRNNYSAAQKGIDVGIGNFGQKENQSSDYRTHKNSTQGAV